MAVFWVREFSGLHDDTLVISRKNNTEVLKIPKKRRLQAGKFKKSTKRKKSTIWTLFRRFNPWTPQNLGRINHVIKTDPTKQTNIKIF